MSRIGNGTRGNCGGNLASCRRWRRNGPMNPTLSCPRGIRTESKETDMLKRLMITTALSGLIAGSALAQGAPAPDAKPATPPAATTAPASPSASAGSVEIVNSQKPDQWLASKFKGTDVVGPDNAKIGDVSDILFDK